MPISRRGFLAGSTALASTTTLAAQRLEALETPAASQTPAVSAAVIALQRMGYGPRPGDVARVTAMGLPAYIEEQLNPAALDDSACESRIANTMVRIKYPAGTGYAAKDELRPLSGLTAPLAQLWPLSRFATPMDWSERIRPAHDVRTATVIRAVYSKRQLQEVLVEFWHNHFNVNAYSDARIACTFPLYDRDVIRANCLGNFRTFLEAVTTSTPMLYYLDNSSNRASGGQGGNENFARELLELHTLGEENYLRFYDDRSQIGVDADGNARGYIDDDIYEASRCLTGWTVADGHWERPSLDTGAFYYDASWHDNYPKTVLSPTGFPNFVRDQPDLADGRKLLDLLVRHRGTARTVCTKLCRRLISDNPPRSVIDAAVNTWMANLTAPDQLKRVVRVILSSAEFSTIWGQKIKRPFEAFVGYLRATNAQLPLSDPADSTQGSDWGDLMWNFGGAGQRLFEWPTPTGHPDEMSYWTSTNGMLRRWNLVYQVTQNWGGNVAIDLPGQTTSGLTCTQIVDFWIDRLCGFTITPTTRTLLIDFMRQGGDANQPPVPVAGDPDWGSAAAIPERLVSMVQLLTMSPDYQLRQPLDWPINIDIEVEHACFTT